MTRERWDGLEAWSWGLLVPSVGYLVVRAFVPFVLAVLR